MAKKLQNDANSPQHDHPNPFHSNNHIHTDSSHPSISSGTSSTHHNRFTTNKESNTAGHDSIDYIPPEISYDAHHDSDVNQIFLSHLFDATRFLFQNEHDDNPGEHLAYIEKHVEFTDDVHNDDENGNMKQIHTQQKLHRRDTPHHLKNKRILNQEQNSVTLDVRFIECTFQKSCDSLPFQQVILHSPTKSSIASGRKDVRRHL